MKIPEFRSKNNLERNSGIFIQKNIMFFWMKVPEFRFFIVFQANKKCVWCSDFVQWSSQPFAVSSSEKLHLFNDEGKAAQ